MLCRSPKGRPVGAPFIERAARSMDIILHIGAHRSATTHFQSYMDNAIEELSQQGVGFWGPRRTRKGLFAGVYRRLGSAFDPSPSAPVEPSVAALTEGLSKAGISKLLVSDENILGALRHNLRHGQLYPEAGMRVRCFRDAFGPSVRRIVINIRSLEEYWCSAIAFGVARGIADPSGIKRSEIANSARSWRDVISDIARNCPETDIIVAPFETYKGRPDKLLEDTTGFVAPPCVDRSPVNSSPALPDLRRALLAQGQDAGGLPFGMGRWNPFPAEAHSALRELYADDLMWLAAGADGLATQTEDRGKTYAAQKPQLAAYERGHGDEFEKRSLARPG